MIWSDLTSYQKSKKKDDMGSMILFVEISDQKVFFSIESNVHSYLYGLYMIPYM